MLVNAVLKGLHYTGLRAVLAPIMRGQGAILMLHRVRPNSKEWFNPNSHLAVAPAFLDKLIGALKSAGHEFISMDEVADRLEKPEAAKGKKPFLAITLDDGYRDNLENAVPIFNKHNVPYLIYIAPGFVDGTATLWWEDLEQIIARNEHIYVELPDGPYDFDLSDAKKKIKSFEILLDELKFSLSEADQRRIIAQLANNYAYDMEQYTSHEIMSWKEINKLSRDPLCTIGAHTIGHYALKRLTEEKCQFEMVQSRDVIKSEIGVEPQHFAYPYGYKEAAGIREFEIAKELGFRTAVTTRHGVIRAAHADHMTALPRVSLNGGFQTVADTKVFLSGVPTFITNRGTGLDVND